MQYYSCSIAVKPRQTPLHILIFLCYNWKLILLFFLKSVIDFSVRKKNSTLNLSGSEEIYKLRQITKKKETTEWNIQDFKNPVLGFLMKFLLPGTGKASPDLPMLLQGTGRDVGGSSQFFSLSFTSGNCARYSIAMLHTRVWNKSAFISIVGHVICCWETQSADSHRSASGGSLCVITVKKEN